MWMRKITFCDECQKMLSCCMSGKNINPEEIEIKLLKTFDTVAEIGVFLHENVLQAIIYEFFRKRVSRNSPYRRTLSIWDVIDSYNHSASSAKRS